MHIVIIYLLDLGVEVLEMYCHGIFDKKFFNLELFSKNLESQFLAQYHNLFIGTLKDWRDPVLQNCTSWVMKLKEMMDPLQVMVSQRVGQTTGHECETILCGVPLIS